MRAIKFFALAVAAMLVAGETCASVVIDDWATTTSPTLVTPGVTNASSSGAVILGGTRFINATLTSSFSFGTFSDNGTQFTTSLTNAAPNNSPAGTSFTLSYATSAVDATQAGANDGVYLFASTTGGTGSSLLLTASDGTNTRTATVAVPPGGFNPYFVNLTSFTAGPASVFTALTSFSLQITYPTSDTSGFTTLLGGVLAFQSSSAVPEPASFGMAVVAVVMAGGFGLRRRAALKAAKPAA